MIFFIFILVSCSTIEQPKSKKQEPKIDRSTPDKLIQTSWSLQIWRDTTTIDTFYSEPYNSKRLNDYFNKVRKNSFNKRLKAYELSPNLIDKVEVQSDSRAVVVVQEYDYNMEESQKVSIILSKENGEWFIDDKIYDCNFCDKTGKVKRYFGLEQCSYCNGLGKRSYYYRFFK